MKSTQEKTVRIRGKTWRLPPVLPFFTGTIVKGNWRFYDVVGFRCPLAGEFYLSGAIVEVWKAPSDLSTPFLVVEPRGKAIPTKVWVKEGVQA